MRLFRLVLLLAFCFSLGLSTAQAQDFGVAESAETIDRGNFKLRANPMFIFGKDGGDGDTGVALLAGYGFTDRFDLEGGVALYDGLRLFGANGEYWIVKNGGLDVSGIVGLHFARGDRTLDTTGVDAILLASGHATRRLDIYGALDLAFEKITDDRFDDSFRTVHLVPGIEYEINRDLDFVAEVGLALNDEARHYFSAGLAYYFR